MGTGRRLQVGATRSAVSRDSDLCVLPISDSAVVMTPQVSVIIPVYNEEGNVAQLQSELAWALKEISHELLFVDDGSRDRTIEQIKPAPGVRILEFEKNTGQSAAIYAGLAAARGKILVLMDGDLQNDPSDIPRLLAEIDRGADLVCGYRLKRQDSWFKRAPKPDRKPSAKPVHQGWRTRHWVHAQSHAARVSRSLDPLPWHAPLHPCSDQRPRLQDHRNSRQPSTAPARLQQIQFR